MMMRIVAVIPARSGSKGIPRKNIIDFCGRPLLAWSILQASYARSVDEVYVSSDDPEILAISEIYGAQGIPRPAELATDSASSESALLHALDWIKETHRNMPDLVAFLQATSPLREPEDIDGAVQRLVDEQATSLFSMSLLADPCIWSRNSGRLSSISYDYRNRACRQKRQPLYLENGSIYVFRPEILIQTGNRLGGKIEMFEMPIWKSFEIDSAEDLELCEYFFRKNSLHRRDYGECEAVRPRVLQRLRLSPFDEDNRHEAIYHR